MKQISSILHSRAALSRVAVLLLAGLLLGCDQSSTSSTVVPTSQPARQVFPEYGIELTPPAGWSEPPLHQSGAAIEWHSPDSTPTDVKAIIAVYIRPAEGESVDAELESQIKRIGGTMDSEGPTIGAERSLWIRGEPTKDKRDRSDKYSLIVKHGQTTYIIRDGFDGRSSRETVKEVARSIRWIPIEKPSQSLDLFDRPRTVMNGQLMINYPQQMRVAQNDSHQFTAGLPAVKQGELEFLTDITVVTIGKGKSLDKVTFAFGERLKARLTLTSDPEWETRFGEPERLMSKPLTALLRERQERVCYAVVRLDAERAAFITCTLGAPDSPQESKLLDVFTKIVDSVRAAGTAENPKEAFHL